MTIFGYSFVIYLIIIGLSYFLIPKKIQWVVLLAGNLVFYAFSGPEYLFFLLSCAFFTWLAALRIEKLNHELKEKTASTADRTEKAELRTEYERKKRIPAAAALVLTLGVWVVLKYGPFFADSFAGFFRIPNGRGFLNYIVPLGMSFYTFDAVGYMLDVGRGKYAADRNYFHYLTFVSYFAHIIQGPFSRYDKLGKTLYAQHSFSYDRFCQGLSRILWGYFKKLIIADKLALSVNEIFAGYRNYYGVQILFGMVLYGIQLYADFSGYIDIVSGISHILGIELDENFRQPYFSKSIDEFWRRWHMTLGHWFRDYLFYPVSRSERMRKIRSKFSPAISKPLVSFIAMFWVWSASGLWHGANWTFLVWGWLNMAVMWISQVLDPFYQRIRDRLHISLQSRPWNAFRAVRTFFIVCFLFFITRAESITHAVLMLRRAFGNFCPPETFSLFPGMKTQLVCVTVTAAVIMLLTDLLADLGRWDTVKERTPFPVRNLIYVLIIVSLVLFAGSGEDVARGFIYANF